jgi:hypothetical protein
MLRPHLCSTVYWLAGYTSMSAVFYVVLSCKYRTLPVKKVFCQIRKDFQFQVLESERVPSYSFNVHFSIILSMSGSFWRHSSRTSRQIFVRNFFRCVTHAMCNKYYIDANWKSPLCFFQIPTSFIS